MELERWLVYASIVLIVIVAPGPAVLLCMSHGLEHGRTRTMATIGGLLSSSLVLISLSALGVGTALAASAFWFDVIRYVGAAYLAYLGISVWRSAGTSPAPNALPSSESVTRKGSLYLFRTGFLVGISNPKDLLFFGAFFPQFMDPARPALFQLLMLSATWLTVALCVTSLYAAFGSRLTRLLGRARIRAWFDRLTGGAFIAAGAALAWFKR